MIAIKLFVALLMLGSVAFAVVAQMRLFGYVKKHPLPESKYTWLFKFIKLRHVNSVYLLSVLAHAVFFTWITFYYL